ncbi:MCE family protein [Mycobacterium intracellulare]|uniref:MCE family protein n=1 Tax=Mycobacterium intracellulare TaxID=1767 RepID=UPI001CDAEB84|nr:MlaD family protein [Mycobacterium intracellulare]MCA2255987.1 MCE family protein [Mycobacterium intracellulare]
MLTRFTRMQLLIFATLTVIAVTALALYYLRLPGLLGAGRYQLYAELPKSGGLYRTANVTYRGVTIGTVTAVEPTRAGARATMSIDDRYKIPVDASANVHSVSAIGEQYLDLVSTANPGQYFRDGQTITKTSVPSAIGPLLDATNRALAVLPKDKVATLLDETAQAVGGLGPALQNLIDSTTSLAHDFKDNLRPVDDIIANAAPIIDSQVNSGDDIERWSSNLDALAAQAAAQDPSIRNTLAQASPTAEAIQSVFSGVRESLPQTLANTEVLLDMLKRYHKSVEQALVILPQSQSVFETELAPYPGEQPAHVGLSLNVPPPCLTGFIPASEWRSPADTSPRPVPKGLYCKIPQETQGVAVRGARNYPCVDVPGKRAATPAECRSTKPYVPAGTNPWYGDPNQIVTCPAPAARCDQPVKPGMVIPAPTIDTGLNPLPADQLPAPPSPISDPLTRPGSGSVGCNGQQPNPCSYAPTPGPTAIYTPQSGELIAPDGTRFTVNESTEIGGEGWKQMLAPAR